MASCFGLLALILLHGLKVTAQFYHPEGNLQATNALVGCTVQLMREFHSNFDTVRIYQSTTPTVSLISTMIRKRIFENYYPYQVVLTNIEVKHIQFIIMEKICLAIIHTQNELEIIVKKLYNEYYHKRAIIILTYTTHNSHQYLFDVMKKIWTKGLPRNIIFIIRNNDNLKIQIISVPEYAKNNCRQIDLIKVGQYHNGVLTKFNTQFYPHVNDLGGCDVLVMVQPQFLPYVVSKDDRHPGGIADELMGILGISMNFTPKYVWSSTAEGMMKHLDESDLNLFMDMFPRATRAITNYRFSVGMSQVTFIVPISEKRELTIRKFLLPFDSLVWLFTLSILVCLMVLSILARDKNLGNISLKIFGSLMGIGVGTFPNLKWIRIFLWCWLLPSYVLIQSYLAFLTKQFTIPIKSQEISTIIELVKSNLNIICSNGTKAGICQLKDSIFQDLCQKCILTSDEDIWDVFYPNFFKTGMMNNTAVISNIEYIKAYSIFSHVHAIDENRTNVNQFIEVRPGSDYIFNMKHKFERLFACGLIQFWRQRYSNFDNKQYPLFNVSDRFMQYEFIQCCFILQSIGLSISIVYFVIEIIVYRLVPRKYIQRIKNRIGII